MGRCRRDNRNTLMMPSDTPIVDLEPLPPPRSKHGRAKPKIAPAKREKVYKRDGYRCVQCKNTRNLTVDHKVPWSKGGTNVMANLQTMCGDCNSLKADA